MTACVLLMTTLFVQAPPTPASSQPPQAPQGTETATAQGQQAEPGKATSSDRPHEFGLGASMGFGTRGGGAAFRYFFNDRVGLNMNTGFSRQVSGGAGSNRTTFQAAPSAVVMLTKSHQLADIDVRPYVGGGLNYSRTSAPIRTSTNLERSSGLGMQVFGGVELTFAEARAIAISAEVAHYQLAVPTFTSNVSSGTNFYLLFHFYFN